MYAELRRHLGEVFRKLAEQKESRIEGKSAIHLARVYGEKKRNFVGQHFWARGYFVSTVRRDETVIREYIRRQKKRTSDWIKSTCGANRPPERWPKPRGRVSDPGQPL